MAPISTAPDSHVSAMHASPHACTPPPRLLKDGVGRIARMTVATNLCQSFDSELKVGE